MSEERGNEMIRPDNEFRHYRNGTMQGKDAETVARYFESLYEAAPCEMSAGDLTTAHEWWDDATQTWQMEHHCMHSRRVIARRRQLQAG